MSSSSSTKVQAYLYDISQGMARSMSPMILGTQIEAIWHSGIVVFGLEVFFGGGVSVGVPGQCIPLRPVRVIELGVTRRTRPELLAYLETLKPQWTRETYSLINRNCNHFADVVSRWLLGVGEGMVGPLPRYVVDLPRDVARTPGGAMLIPMIEGFEREMQGNLRGGGGLDPFRNTSTNSTSIALGPRPPAYYICAYDGELLDMAIAGLKRSTASPAAWGKLQGFLAPGAGGGSAELTECFNSTVGALVSGSMLPPQIFCTGVVLRHCCLKDNVLSELSCGPIGKNYLSQAVAGEGQGLAAALTAAANMASKGCTHTTMFALNACRYFYLTF
jgi:hypothetical protein